MTITAAQVKELREKTGAGMMDAKNALTEAEGNMDKAVEILRQKGIATAEKKSGRTTAEGLVISALAQDGKAGVLLEVNCETDFVAKGEAFTEMAQDLAQQILKNAPESVEVLLSKPSLKDSGTVKDYLTEKIASIKENLSVRRFVRYEIENAGVVHSYIHTGSKIGVLIEIVVQQAVSLEKPEMGQLVKDIAMQIASTAPEFVQRSDISQAVIDEETRVEMGKEDILNKPEAIRPKIVAGRVDKLLAQRVLLEQPFVKDPAKTIQELLNDKSAALNDTIEIRAFTRYVLGEGIEKAVNNFAEEVAATAAGK